MFTINTCIKGRHKPLQDCYIIINGKKCQCDKAVAIKISPVIKKFYKNKENKNNFFNTKISDNHTPLDNLNSSTNPDASAISTNMANSLNSIYIMISKLFSGGEISIQEDNFNILNLIGNHFRIQEIIHKIEEYSKYLKMISSYFKDSIDFKEMIKLEKILLFEINETNIEAKVKEYESFIKKIPIRCFIHFVINVCTKNYYTTKVNTNEFVIEIIKNVNNIVQDTLRHFLSILYHQFILINSISINDIDKFNISEINSLIHQVLIDGLMENFKENLKFNQNEVIIPDDLQKYFNKKSKYLKLTKEKDPTHRNREKKDQFFSQIEFIKKDNIDSFQNYIVNSQTDVNCNIENNITKRISFIDNGQGCSLIELSAFYGSIKCFTYLFIKQANYNKNRLSYFAVAGGNPEIIHICEREECAFNEQTLEISIEYHKHLITKWLVDTKKIIINERNLRNSIIHYNIKAIKYLIKKGINIDKMMIYICESNNIILFKWFTVFLKNYEMKIIYEENKKTALHIACQQNNAEIVKLLISRDDIDINSIYKVYIWKYIIFYYVNKNYLKSNESYFFMF